MAKEKEIDCRHTKEVVCPYCGKKFSDSWELAKAQDDEIQEDCDECGKKFIYTTDYTVTFYSHQVPCLNGAPHEWGKPHDTFDDEGNKFHTCKACGKFEVIPNDKI